MRLLVSMRCFLSAPFAFAAFEVIVRRYAPATKWNVLQLIGKQKQVSEFQKLTTLLIIQILLL